jgi:hypothetical protein
MQLRMPLAMRESCLFGFPRERPHILMIVVRDARSVPVHAHDGGIDHLLRRIVTGGTSSSTIGFQTPGRRQRTKQLLTGGARTVIGRSIGQYGFKFLDAHPS